MTARVTAQSLFVGVVAACLVNGLVSPVLGLVLRLYPVWMPEVVPVTPETVFYGASLMVSTATLLLSAVPAAAAERLGGLSPRAAVGVWLAGALALLAWSLR